GGRCPSGARPAGYRHAPRADRRGLGGRAGVRVSPARHVPPPAVERAVLSQARLRGGAPGGHGTRAPRHLRRGGAGRYRPRQARCHAACAPRARPRRGRTGVTTRRCAFLAMDSNEGWSVDVELAIAPLEARGWQVELVPWRRPAVDWSRFDAVYIGT